MVDDSPNGLDTLTIDTANLFREESITDTQSANIKQLIPITLDGTEDSSRDRQFIGDTTLMTQMGPIPVQFPIPAKNLQEAFTMFPEGVQGAVEKLQERAQEMAREEASRIVVPGQEPNRGGFGGRG
ncbi:MAG: cytoplasmic protein [Proteobacteria bacterium]|jgi:hypothetical protein|nr:cytoplasmic protein [Pseudomonadota bacterium]MBT5065646.1 cytoplasmic protein [Pseudomonadota bacterium]MBT6192962.1 cytoplasmic protein [Pseudomonadota bacterium]MBT6464928.1 cytoplasmic protein [Pseudomonadota bacterium]MBT6673867.1 cytoplasmic protein [Pseudomonadota bacterium]